jgi:hypothetical protein
MSGKKKVYHSDFYISEIDLVIEIKSSYWYYKLLEKNKAKINYTKKHHNFILILDKNYDDFNDLLKIFSSLL